MAAQSADIVIIGAGIAGATAAYHLAAKHRVILLERESQPGYHSTGRSAALFAETYGNRPIRALTVASRAFLMEPPEGFSETPILTPRGVMHVGTLEKAAYLDAFAAELRQLVPSVRRLSPDDVLKRMPILKPEVAAGGGVAEPEAMDIDVHALHRGYLRGAQAQGAKLVCDAEATALEYAGGLWHVTTPQGEFAAPILVNGAGAWSDQVGQLAGLPRVGLQPKRRTAFTIDPPAGMDVSAWPMVIDSEETLYFKPDAGRILISPADETPSEPVDAQPDEMDVAIAADRFETMTTMTVRRPVAKWAGLRSFVSDKTIVVGFEKQAPGFFWLAGQGGYGIQTSAAVGRVVARLIGDAGIPEDIAALGVSDSDLSPERLR